MELLYHLVNDKLIPLVLLFGAALSYHYKLPDVFSEGLAAAGLIAFQATKSTSSQT